MKQFGFTLLVVMFALTSLTQAQPPVASPPAAILADKKPDSTEAENLKFYREFEVNILKNGMTLQRALNRHPPVFAVIPKEAQQNPIAWLQKNLKVEIDIKKHQLRISLPKGIKQWQQAGVDAITREALIGTQTLEEKAKNTLMVIDSMISLQNSLEKKLKSQLKIPLENQSEQEKRAVLLLKEKIEKTEKKIQNLLDQLVSNNRLFLLKAKGKPVPKQK